MRKNYHFPHLAFSSILLLSLFTQMANAQNRFVTTEQRLKSDKRIESYEMSNERKTASMIVFKDAAAVNKDAVAALFKNFLDLNSGIDELRTMNVTNTGANISVQRFQQYYKGIKVEHGVYVAAIKSDNVHSLNGSFYDVPGSLNTKASLTEKNALDKAIAFVKPTQMAYEQLDALIKENPEQSKDLEVERNSLLPKGELVIVKDFVNGTNTLHLAYKFDIYASVPLYRAYVYVDANTGSILLEDAQIKHTDGTAQTRYAGTRHIETKKIKAGPLGKADEANKRLPFTWSAQPLRTNITNSTFYILHDETRGNGVMTYDLNGVGGLPVSLKQIYKQATSFTDPDNVWGDGNAVTHNDHIRGVDLGGPGAGGLGEMENDDIAIDAHWGAEMVYDYWKNIHNRLSFDNLNSAIKSYVHYGPAYDNAFWDGSVMTYGDGSGDDNPLLIGFKPLVSLDVCGHEIGHGVCSNTCNLVYEKESGAMNEGFSDIWASCMENYVLTHVDATLPYDVWAIGEQIDLSGTGSLRRMDNPKYNGNPDTYGGQYWSNPNCSPNLLNDYCGVHNNSGVLNHWFYEMVAGDNMPHTNDIGSTYTVKGIGFSDGEQIAYLTEVMLFPTATFADARAASIQAATQLFGVCSPQYKATVNAWYAVGVGAAAQCTQFANAVNSNAQQVAAYKTMIYPNPASNTVEVSITSNKSNNLSIALLDNYGTRIELKNINAVANTKTWFDVSKLASGTYWIRINDGNSSTVKKLIIQH